jgi:hypothetical protein
MKVKLVDPEMGKNYSLQFFDVPKDKPVRMNIWYWARHFGEFYHTNPFLQGDDDDWMMVEFWTSSQAYILECCLAICKQLNLELEI